MRDPQDPRALKAVTNNFSITGLTLDDLPFVCFPFVGVPGKLDIQIHDCIGSTEQKEELFNLMTGVFNQQRRATGFLTPVHSALHTYWYNIASDRVKYDVRSLKGALNGKPVLYIGAGPSTAHNAELIKKIQQEGKAYIITGGTGIPILHDLDIVPDLCLALDPFEQEYDRFKDLSEEWQKKTTLLASPSLNPYCYEGWKGKLIAAEGLNAMNVGEFIEGDIEQIEEGPIGVTTWMTEVVDYLGAKEIYFVGTDLCFGPNHETYAGDKDMVASKYIYIPDYHGKATRTNWIHEAEFLSKAIEEKGYSVTNTSNGIPIENTKNGSLDELLTRDSFSAEIKLKKWTKAKYKKIKTQLKSFVKELRFTRENLASDELHDQVAYKYLIKSYDNMQEYQYWRTGIYNYSLIREVCQENANIVEDILKGKTYGGELLYGHLGSPKSEVQEDKVRTGSKYVKEFRDETTRRNYLASKAKQ
jgi:hypothetical protein